MYGSGKLEVSPDSRSTNPDSSAIGVIPALIDSENLADENAKEISVDVAEAHFLHVKLMIDDMGEVICVLESRSTSTSVNGDFTKI